MDADADMIPSSPSAETSPSSSDIATESTGSFFRDRSTTLGTLMGVSLADEEQEQGQDHHHHHHQSGQDAVDGTGTVTPRAPVHEDEGDGWRWRRRWRRRHWRSAGGWWRLCRDDVRVPTSLGHFLDMERQLSGTGLLCGGDGAGERDAAAAADETGRWKLRRPAQGTSSSLARLPVLLTAICSGGAA
ncbi:hypothetical protein BDA96_04G264200 [Sorghum bicolor]|uniref:Uncharacterized protein n=2 Tax=Sorghum bicolor TaxID=4558 RepID=A0A921R5B0_SORBI|nr:uncharacterized protein At3g17950 [Sorghum bicolor]EES05571.1 hypothetical protein SORBI_3004G248000 [Sorghum bicolor]KAG0534254.1 hypothetical protein BDA96_04G264200 [Sorghum bicolor]|eukprot:XP_002452595.1 uncharacterized protein At3g17950 [Sorghum bicolor]